MPACQAEATALNSQGKAAEAPARPGTDLPRAFGRVVLLKHLARGGMGDVFLATTGGIEGAERPCVVKLIRTEHAEDSSFLARFLDEARIQAQLAHPGVAQILEAAADSNGRPFVVVEHVEGRNLAELRTRAAQLGVCLDWADALAVAVAMGEALTYIHECTDSSGRPLEIVHRDLSPQNVMVGYGGDLKLIDFGTARALNRRCHTVSGVVYAKPGYVAPEVASNIPGGVPADLYAFGVMLWELIAGRRFLNGDVAVHLQEVAAGRRFPTPIAEAASAPALLDDVIARLTAHRPEERYASAREATQDLLDLLKLAPCLEDGQRGVRVRIARLMRKLYPAEPTRSRAEFTQLLDGARHLLPKAAPRTRTVEQQEADSRLLAGTRYELLGELGRGGMGVVHRARHADLGRTVALKILPEGFAAHAELAERFRTEARIIAGLSHDNLVKIHDFGFLGDGRPYYAMELVDGYSLEELLRREKGMDWREALRFGIQACRALEVAHAAGVVHCDIKPGNLMVTRDGTLKLCDFGVARVRDEKAASSAAGKPQIVGTPEYMAPEQAAGGTTDERADLYALGAVLYELVTGCLPYDGPSTLALLEAKRSSDCVAPVRRAPHRGLPKNVDALLRKALARLPEERFQTAAEMRQALRRAVEAPAQRGRAGRLVASAAALTLLVGAVGLGVTRDHGQLTAMLGQFTGVSRSSVPAAAESPLTSNVAPVTAQVIAPASKATVPVALAVELPDVEVADAAEAVKPAELPAGDVIDADALIAAGELAAAPVVEDGATAPSASGATAADPAWLKALAQAQRLLDSGNKVKALSSFRRLAERRPDDPRVLSGWVEAARSLKGWGEAVRVARHWSTVDQSAEAWLALARAERNVGSNAKAQLALEQLLAREPGNAEAQRLLETSGRRSRVAMDD